MNRPSALPLIVVLLPLTACPMVGDGTDGGADRPTDAGTETPAYDVDVAPVCGDGTRFEAGAPAFVEVTDAWKLATVGVQGTRLNVADIDGDGWADLLVRRGGSRADDLSEGGARHSWLLRNTGEGFDDVTEASGLLSSRGDLGGLGRPYEVVAFADVDNDGDQDVYTGLATADDAVAMGETSELLLNDGSGVFTLGPADNAARRAGLVDAVAGASFIDVDLDGVLDLWTPQHNFDLGGGTVFAQDRAYRGVGNGAFEDVTSSWGLSTNDWASINDLNNARAHTRAWGANACDLNGDGVTELLAPSYGRSPNHLWQGGFDLGNVRFANRSVASGYAYDDNLEWSDNQFARCYCQSNPGADGCAGVPAPLVQCSPNWNHQNDREPFRLGGNSGASVCADVDNDGDLDVLTTEIKHWWAGEGADGSELLLNTGEADVRFERPGDAALGLAIDHSSSSSWDEGHMSAAIFDCDNDGRLRLRGQPRVALPPGLAAFVRGGRARRRHRSQPQPRRGGGRLRSRRRSRHRPRPFPLALRRERAQQLLRDSPGAGVPKRGRRRGELHPARARGHRGQQP
jgi:hypothetical protein